MDIFLQHHVQTGSRTRPGSFPMGTVR